MTRKQRQPPHLTATRFRVRRSSNTTRTTKTDPGPTSIRDRPRKPSDVSVAHQAGLIRRASSEARQKPIACDGPQDRPNAVAASRTIDAEEDASAAAALIRRRSELIRRELNALSLTMDGNPAAAGTTTADPDRPAAIVLARAAASLCHWPSAGGMSGSADPPVGVGRRRCRAWPAGCSSARRVSARPCPPRPPRPGARVPAVEDSGSGRAGGSREHRDASLRQRRRRGFAGSGRCATEDNSRPATDGATLSCRTCPCARPAAPPRHAFCARRSAPR
jgi:hypothetical protein